MKKSRDKHPLVRRIAYMGHAVLLFSFYGLFKLLPVSMASSFGGWIGRMLGPLLPVTKRARTNINYVFPECDHAKQNKIISGMWDNMGRVFAEAAHLEEYHTAPILTLEGSSYLQAAQNENRPIIFLCGHFANWEISAIAAWRAGVPLTVVYRRPNNPYADWLVKRIRRHVAPISLPKGKEGARGILKQLAVGGAVGLLTDQKMNDGIPAQLLDKPAMTVNAPFIMGLKTNAVFLPATTIREKGHHFRVTIHPPLQPNPSHDFDTQVATLTQSMNDIFSDHIRAHPAQWLWLHRRWGKDAERKV